MDFSLKAIFGVDTAGARAELKKFGADIAGLGGEVSSLGRVLGAIGPLLGIGALIGFTKNIVDAAGKTQDLADNLGISTDALQAFNYQGSLGGVEAEQLSKLWEKSAKAIDGLLAGTEAETKAFDALHLSQKDLIGLPLPEQVEKIAKAFNAAKGEAGAYDALIQIIGDKSGPKMLAMLDDLANKGLAGFTDEAKKAGQVIDSEFIGAMDRFGDKATTVWGAIKTTAGSAIGGILSSMEKLGGLVGGVVYGGEAMTEAFTKTAAASEDIATKTKGAEEAAKKLAETQQKIFEDEIKTRASIAEKQQSAYNSSLSSEARISALKDEIATKEASINVGLFTGKNLEEQKNYLAARKVELTQAEIEAQKDLLAEQRKLFDAQDAATEAFAKAKFEELSDAAKLLVLQKEKVDLEDYLRQLPKQSTEYKEQYVVLAGIKKQITDLTPAEAARLTVGEQQTAEYRKQVALMNELAKTMMGIAGIRGGSAFNNASDDALKATVARNREQARQLQANPTFNSSAGLANQNEAARLLAEAANAQKELDTRAKVRSAFASGGTQGVYRAFSDVDPLILDKMIDQFARNLDESQKTSASLAAIQQGLVAAGFIPSL